MSWDSRRTVWVSRIYFAPVQPSDAIDLLPARSTKHLREVISCIKERADVDGFIGQRLEVSIEPRTGTPAESDLVGDTWPTVLEDETPGQVFADDTDRNVCLVSLGAGCRSILLLLFSARQVELERLSRCHVRSHRNTDRHKRQSKGSNAESNLHIRTLRGAVALTDRVLSGKRVRVDHCSRVQSVSFAGYRFPPEVILLAVCWYL